MSGKGSRPRPFSVDQNTFSSNWDAIWGKKKAEDKTAKEFDEKVVMKPEYYDEDIDPDNPDK